MQSLDTSKLADALEGVTYHACPVAAAAVLDFGSGLMAFAAAALTHVLNLDCYLLIHSFSSLSEGELHHILLANRTEGSWSV